MCVLPPQNARPSGSTHARHRRCSASPVRKRLPVALPVATQWAWDFDRNVSAKEPSPGYHCTGYLAVSPVAAVNTDICRPVPSPSSSQHRQNKIDEVVDPARRA